MSARLVEVRADGVQVIEVTMRVEVDPTWHGFDCPLHRLAARVLDVVDSERGFEVLEESRAAVRP